MRFDHMKALKQYTDNLLAHVRLLLIGKVRAEEVEKSEAEILSVAIGVTQLIRHCAEEGIASLRV